MLDIIERWERTKLICGVAENQVASMCYMLENQMVFNNKRWNDPEAFKRISIPLNRRIFPSLKSHDNYRIESQANAKDCLVEEFKIKLANEIISLGDHSNNTDLNYEAELISQLAEGFREKIDQFIESKLPFKTFYANYFGYNENNGNLVLYYNIED